MSTPRDDQFHQDKSFSKSDAPRPGGEPDEALEGAAEKERPVVVGGLKMPESQSGGIRGHAERQPAQRPVETVDEEVAGRFLDPLPERHRPKGDDPEGTMADWNRGEGRP